jgi:putative heme transporter
MWRRDRGKAAVGGDLGVRGERHNGEPTAEVARVGLAGMFAAPAWLRDLGGMAWLLVGVAVLLAGVVVIMALTSTIVVPVITAAIVAAVLSPAVHRLEPRLGRAGATVVVFALILAAALAMTVLVLGAIAGRAPSVEGQLDDAAATIQGWVQDLGVSAAQAKDARSDASAGVSDAFDVLLDGLATGINALASLAVFLSFTALSLFFLLKDGPVIRRWTESHMGVPEPVARTITGRTLQALRGYFVGVTAVAAFNAVVIGVAALLFDVPQAGTIAVVNFAAAYVPYLGAWTAGAFTVLLALGAEGATTALAMAVVVLLANGALQQLVQPLAFGAALGIHPLAVLIVTIAGGSLFGGVGLILAAPLTSAAVHISTDLGRGRAAHATDGGGAPDADADGGRSAEPASGTPPPAG